MALIDKDTQNAFVQGEEWALEVIIQTYSAPLLRYCITILCNSEEAKDVLQDTFIKAYQKRKRFNPDTSLSSWLYRIAYTTAIDVLRKSKRRLKLMDKYRMEADNQNNTISEPLRSILISLPVMDRALLYGRVIDEKSYSEMSLILNASEAALRKRFERLRSKLAVNIEKRATHLLKKEYAK